MRRHPSVRGEDALRLDEAMDVLGRRLPANEDHRFSGLAALLRAVRVEDDLPRRGPGRGIETLRGDLERRVRIETRVQELVELAGVDSRHGLFPLAPLFCGHVDRSL